MARELGRLNPGFTGSTISLDRRSNVSDSSLNAIGNVSYGDGSESAYSTLQRNHTNNVNPSQRIPNPLYDDVRLAAGTQNSSKTSQTSKKLARTKQRRRERVIRVVLIFLIVAVAVVALLLSLLLMMGKIGPKCSCSTSDASPRAGAQSSSEEPAQQSSTLKQNTFNLDLSPFHGILDELQANVSSLRRQAESMMKESNENKDALMAAKAKFNNTREAVTNFVSQINTVINHANNSVQEFDPDNGPIFNRFQDLNATLQRELGEMKQTYEQYNIDIDNRIDVMNNTIAEKVAIKLSEPGPTGERGQDGSKGPTGETGPHGPQGPNGTKGAKGPRGGKGLQGDSGFPGRNGSKGLTGDKGIKGPKGDNGTTGPAGNPGEEGTRGIGNFSWCEQTNVQDTIDKISRSDTQNIKIMGASCTTATPGAEANLQTTVIAKGYKYDCVCKPGTPICRLNYWACPIMAP